jgi:hypothetical protein
VAGWAEEAGRRLAAAGSPAYESIHLDDLSDGWYTHERAVAYAIDCVAVLGGRTSKTGLSFRVAVPLRSAPELMTVAPVSLPSDVDPLEPPSLYACRDILTMYVPYFEEFRIPVDGPTGSTACYYSCFRSPEAARLGWEYSRVVWFDIMTDQSARQYHAMIRGQAGTAP